MAESATFTADFLRRRFAGTVLPDNPGDVIELPGSRHWPDKLQEQLRSGMTPAGVLIPIFDRREQEMSVLLTQRSAALKHHAGQVSFPGGRMETGDADIQATALRETHEEVGIPADLVSVIGCLAPMPTITGYAVTPIVGIVEADIEPTVDRTEVELAFEVPLSFLADPRNRQLVERNLYGKLVPMVEFHYAGHRIWGATAIMIMEFIKVLKKN